MSCGRDVAAISATCRAVKTHWPWRPDTKNWQQIFSAVQLVPAIILLY
jgi:hypothetical protein